MMQAWADIDNRKLPTLHVDKQVEATLAAFDALLPAPKYIKLNNSKKTEYIIVNGKRVSFTGNGRSGGAWASYHTFKKMFHDIVKGGWL